MDYRQFLSKLPAIKKPEKRQTFKQRITWSAVIVLIFLIMGQVTVYGVSPQAYERFKDLQIILGSTFGSLVTLGIGPIVTASIILQLLVGSKIIPWDLNTPKGKAIFQGTQKLAAIFFCIVEAVAYVGFGAVALAPGISPFLVIAQLAVGALLVLYMDEVVSKWGFGSGVSLFIAAGVTKTIFIGAFSPLLAETGGYPVGAIPLMIVAFAQGDVMSAMFNGMIPVVATLMVFLIVVYAQSIRVEIPLAFGSIRGFGRRWPLKFLYTSNIPVILTAALMANLQLWASMMAAPTFTGSVTSCGPLGCFEEGTPISGVVYFLTRTRSAQLQIFTLVAGLIIFAGIVFAAYVYKRRLLEIGSLSVVVGLVAAYFLTSSIIGLPPLIEVARAATYLIFMMVGATIFSVFWVTSAGMDARSVAKQIESVGMAIPGFRRDPRIIVKVLNRYIPALAVMGGAFVGFLAAMADFTGALGTGTGILLTVMIIFNLYEQIAQQHMEDLHPALRNFLGE